MEGKVEEKKVRKGRSPAYPGIDISSAIQRARELYKKENQHKVNVKTAVGHWNYKFGTGVANIALASLKKYGFLEDEGSGEKRSVRLTDLVIKIILDNRLESPDRNNLIIKAALTPKIHADLYDEYGNNLPSDENLLYHLRVERKFTESGARDFISQFKRTLEFIKNLKSGSNSSNSGDKGQGSEEIKLPFTLPPPKRTPNDLLGEGRKVKNIEIPIPHESWPTLSGVFPMSEGAWESMMKLLEAMKPGLVKSDEKKP